MEQLTLAKKKKLLSSLKNYRKKYQSGKYHELDESATRIMVNSFLTDILGYTGIEEIKTEYMIRGTYADYVIQVKGKRYFIVEVKAMGIELSQKHLRQAINYAANEGIEWMMLTNGKIFVFYKIIFSKPIDYRQIFSIDISNEGQLKIAMDCMQYLTKQLVIHKGLENLWHKHSALEPCNISRFFYAKPIINYLKRQLKRTYKTKFSDDDIKAVIKKVIVEKVEDIQPRRTRKIRRIKNIKTQVAANQLTSTAPAITT